MAWLRPIKDVKRPLVLPAGRGWITGITGIYPGPEAGFDEVCCCWMLLAL